MVSQKRFGFAQNMRLPASQIKKLLACSGMRLHKSGISLYAHGNSINSPRLAVLVGKKSLRLAAQRNRFKRTVRESFRINRDTLPGADILILARSAAAKHHVSQIRHNLQELWLCLQHQHHQLAGANCDRRPGSGSQIL